MEAQTKKDRKRQRAKLSKPILEILRQVAEVGPIPQRRLYDFCFKKPVHTLAKQRRREAVLAAALRKAEKLRLLQPTGDTALSDAGRTLVKQFAIG